MKKETGKPKTKSKPVEPEPERHPEPIVCHFCGRRQNAVIAMISAPADFQAAYICDFCVEICTSIIADRAKNLADAMKHGLALLRRVIKTEELRAKQNVHPQE